LIDNGADVNKLNELGKTPLDHFLSRIKINSDGSRGFNLGLTVDIFKNIMIYLLFQGATYNKSRINQIFQYREKEGEVLQFCVDEWQLRKIKPAKCVIK
jgi:pyruvate dehydrogenase complex dehydrogenase (E1) component